MAEVVTQQREESSEQTPVDQLAEFLRAHPYKLNHNKAELAERFGLEVEFVTDVIDTLKGSPNRLSPYESVSKIAHITWQNVSTFLKWAWSEFTEKPYVAIPVTVLLTAATVMVMLALEKFYGLFTNEDGDSTLLLSILILVFSMGFLHLLCYLRYGMIRYVFFGSGVFAAALLPMIYYLYEASKPIQIVPGQPMTLGNSLGAGLLLVFVYFFGMSIVSLYGGYTRTRQADAKEKRLSRQQLLDRMFELQEEMAKMTGDGEVRRATTVIGTLRNSPWLPLLALGVGACIGAFGMLLRFNWPSVGEIVMMVKAIGYLGVGYLTASLRKSVVVLSLMFAGMLAVELIIVGLFGPDHPLNVLNNRELVVGLFVMLMFGMGGSSGAHIDERARVRRKLAENDPAHVVAELVELQWRLKPTTEASCVVSVDVAGSTAMKSAADPLMIEYSFRAYQEFLMAIADKRGGVVLSTAGDGAVLNFQSCAEALYAAKEIQTEIGRFNSRTNRLSSPFRVRVGIHTGEVTAQLKDVPFSELIDISSHVERESPVGGIAITQSVVDHLEDEHVAALQEKVDGQTVYFVLNPTFSA